MRILLRLAAQTRSAGAVIDRNPAATPIAAGKTMLVAGFMCAVANNYVAILLQELCHVLRGCGCSRVVVRTQQMEHKVECVLVLVESRRLEFLLRERTDYDRHGVTAAMREVGEFRFIENNNKQPVGLEYRTGDQGRDVLIQPAIRLGKSSIMGIVKIIGDDEGEVRQLSTVQVGSELRERHDIALLRRASLDVGEKYKWVVVLCVWIDVAAKISD